MLEESMEDRFCKLLDGAGIPEEDWGGIILGIGSFTTIMTNILIANSEVAPNYLTFGTVTNSGEVYELTVKKCSGKSPAEVIAELEEKLKRLRFITGKYAAKFCSISSSDGSGHADIGRAMLSEVES